MTSEELHNQIALLGIIKKCSLFDAVIYFLEENAFEVEDIVKKFDKITILRLRQSAIENNLIRRKAFMKMNCLPFK